MSSPSENKLPPLIAALLKPSAHVHLAASSPLPVRLIETHISWVILAGDYAYKIKKPRDFGFLDFSSLEKRHHFCAEELRLNRRLAPDIYLAVVAITGSAQHPQIEGGGEVLEWAVKMRAFPADATLDREAGIRPDQIDAIADRIAEFHAEIAVAPATSDYGNPAAVNEPVQVNFDHLRSMLPILQSAHPLAPLNSLLDKLHAWSKTEGERLNAHFIARKKQGFVRECHGDLHLGNIAWVNNQALIFDALEFNPALRHIDVISEIAFLSMDLQHRGRLDLAWRLLDRYLERTGDIGGIETLPYYQVYRAMVRAKVAALLATEYPRHVDQQINDCLAYLQLADRLSNKRRPALVLMHGVSGSGKTWLSQHLLEQLGAIRLRSDVTRKRLFGLKPLQDSRTIPDGIYTPTASAHTLARLIDDTRMALTAGFLVIVDATFIHLAWRAPFRTLAEALGVEWHIVALEAPGDVLKARIAQRQQSGIDASEAGLAVLESQLNHLEPFTPEESPHVLHLGNHWTVTDAIAQLRKVLDTPKIAPKP